MGWNELAIRKRKPLRGRAMDSLIEGISSFISKAVTLILAGSFVALVAGEVKLVAL